MSAAGVVEPVDVLEDGGLCLTPGWPTLPADEFRLQGFEERLDEPPHVCRRLQLLSRMSHHEQDDEQICTRGTRAGYPHGLGSRAGLPLTLGNDDHIQLLTLAKAFGADPKTIKFVVYPNTAAEQIPALLGGHIKAITISMAEVMEQVKAKKIRLLGVSAPTRTTDAPDVPTWKEQGVDFVFPHWRGVQAAPGLTPEQQKFWTETITKMVATKTWKDSLKTLNWDSLFQNTKDYGAFLDAQDKLMKESLKDVGLIK